MLHQAPAETRKDVLPRRCSSSDPNETQRFQLAEQIFDHLAPNVGAILRESTLEIASRCPAPDQREHSNGQRRTPGAWRRHLAEHTTRYSTETTSTTRLPTGASTSTVSP